MKKSRKSKSNLLTQTFRFQPGLVLGVLGLAFLGGGVMLTAGATSSTTVGACKPVAVSSIATATPGSDQVDFELVSTGQGGTATVAVKAGSSCTGPLISLVSYTAPAADGGTRKLQHLFDSQTKALALGVVNMQVKIPDCFYQIDLAYGQPLDLTTGVDYSGKTNLLWAATGGTRVCVAATPTPTPSATPKPSATPRPTVSVLPVSPSPSVTPTPSNNASPTPTPSMSPTPSPSGTPKPSVSVTPTATPGSGGHTPKPSPTPVVIPLGPGESTPTPTPTTTVLSFLPQTGQAGSFMTFLGALLVTIGLFHIYLTQRRKLVKTSKLR